MNPVPSRDGHKLFAVAAQSRGELVHYDAAAKQFTPYLGGISASDLDFTRDGKWVTYITVPDGILWRSRVDGSQRLQLTEHSGMASLPRWSPDGKWIAFDWRRSGEPWSIRIISADGGTARDALRENLNQVDATWNNDGTMIAFGRTDMGVVSSDLAIFILNLKTGSVSKVPRSEGWFSPRWSPDGRYIAAIRGDFSKLAVYDLKTQTWSDWVDTSINYPTWANDSRSLYFDTMFGAPPIFGVAQVGSTQFRELFPLGDLHRFWGTWGSWSGVAPDGSGLFVRDITPQEVYAIDIDLP
jgi:Tol biopolymer transport system component